MAKVTESLRQVWRDQQAQLTEDLLEKFSHETLADIQRLDLLLALAVGAEVPRG